MNKHTFTVFIMLLVFAIGACEREQHSVYGPPIQDRSNSELLVEEIKSRDSVMSGAGFPYIIESKEVMQNIDSNYLVVDLRSESDFSAGHIKGAVNIKLSDVADFARVSGFPMYKKVVFVCYSGQTAGHAVGALHALGYPNVYVMRWGMAGWTKKFVDRWESNIGDIAAGNYVKTASPKQVTEYKLPNIKAKRPSGKEMLEMRTQKMLYDSFADLLVDLNCIIEYKEDVHVLAYVSKELYDMGHIEGVIHVTPGTELNEAFFKTLPTDKTIVVYSKDGHESAYFASYLKIMGYETRSIKYGMNSFMHSLLVENFPSEAFLPNKVNNFPLVVK